MVVLAHRYDDGEEERCRQHEEERCRQHEEERCRQQADVPRL